MSIEDLLMRLDAVGTSTSLEAARHISKLETTIQTLVEEMEWVMPILAKHLTHPNDEAWLLSFDEALKKAKECLNQNA